MMPPRSTPAGMPGSPAASLESPIFVVGMPRSGTTLVRSLLSAHPAITIAAETHLLSKFARDYPLSGDPGLARFRELWAAYTRHYRFKDLAIEAAAVEQEILAGGEYSLRAIFRSILVHYARARGKRRWGEKTPDHYRHVGTLLAWFPDARIVFLVRDPRAVVASNLRAPWISSLRHPRESRTEARFRLAVRHAQIWARMVDSHLRRWESDERVLVVPYEELVRRPEAVLRSLCLHVGERYDERMITHRSFHEVPPPADPVFEGSHASWRREHLIRSFQPIRSGGSRKWREALLPHEIAAVEAACCRQMTERGYAASTFDAARPPLAQRLRLTGWRLRWAVGSGLRRVAGRRSRG